MDVKRVYPDGYKQKQPSPERLSYVKSLFPDCDCVAGKDIKILSRWRANMLIPRKDERFTIARNRKGTMRLWCRCQVRERQIGE